VPKPFFRADHVGSLLRPASVLAARERFARGEMDAALLRAEEDRSIAEAVAGQERAGLPVVTDGEFRRENWWIDFIGTLDGVRIDDDAQNPAFTSAAAVRYVPKTVRTVGKIGRMAPIMAGEYRHLASVAHATAKVTLPSPSRINVHGGRGVIAREVYPDLDTFYADVARVYQQEIEALEAAGCRYIQIDDPVTSYFIDEKMRAQIAEQGDAPDVLLARFVALVNACIAKRHPDTAIGVHICRGNARSAWMAAGGYERIAETVLAGMDVDHFLLEYDDERSGDFAPLAAIPRGKRVVLGLVTSKHGTLEDPEVLKRRVGEAARYIPLEDLALSPQCGFASTHEGNILTAADQWAKLRLVVAAARDIWGDVRAS
jgi:5-methyltetrahydropteroyltriglutamate--homocysteine methyltransferase